MKTHLAKYVLSMGWLAGWLSWNAVADVPPIPPPPIAPAAPVAPAVANAGGPRIQFETPTYDFGKINSGAVVKHDFIFTNTGTATLEVTDVRPGCGCTTAGAWTKTVEPGQTGTIPIQFNSGNFSGPVQKNVTVTCNVASQPQTILYFKGTIWKAIDVNPTYAYFTPLADAQTNDTRIVRIVNNTDEVLTLSAPESANTSFKAELKTIKEGKEFELHISTTPPFGPGTVQGPVTVKTSSTNMPVITVNAIVMVQPVVLAMPSQITLPGGPLAVPTKMTVTVRNNGSSVMAVSEPTVTVAGVEAVIQELQAGKVYSVNLTCPTGFEVGAGQRAELTVKTTHPQYPLIRVPIFQTPRPAQQPPTIPPPPAVPAHALVTPIPPPPPVPPKAQ